MSDPQVELLRSLDEQRAEYVRRRAVSRSTAAAATA